MTVAYEVLAVYAALVVWAVTLATGVRTKNYWPFLGVGLGLALFLSVRYLLVVTGPLLKNWATASILFSVWFSAPLGILIAERIRGRAARTGPSRAAAVSQAQAV
jgi:hypothetical protein